MTRPKLTWARARTGILGLIVVWAGWLTWSLADRTTTAEQATGRAATAERTLDQLADDVATTCHHGGDAAAKLGTICLSAERVQQTPHAPLGDNNSADGRGITATSIRNGHLAVSYSDGTTTDAGPVAGTPGTPGPPGRGIAATLVDAGELVLVYTDGAREPLGRIAGRDGTDGRGIATITTDGGRLHITYTDGTSEDAGPLPPGPRGADGRGVQRAWVEGCRWHVTYTDGTTEDAGNACTTETVTPPTSSPPSSGKRLLPIPTEGP